MTGFRDSVRVFCIAEIIGPYYRQKILKGYNKMKKRSWCVCVLLTFQKFHWKSITLQRRVATCGFTAICLFCTICPVFLDGTFSFDFVPLSGFMPTNRLKDQETDNTDNMKFRLVLGLLLAFEACNHVFEIGPYVRAVFLNSSPIDPPPRKC